MSKLSPCDAAWYNNERIEIWSTNNSRTQAICSQTRSYLKSFRGHLLQRAKPTATAALSSPEPCFDTTSFVQNLTREECPLSSCFKTKNMSHTPFDTGLNSFTAKEMDGVFFLRFWVFFFHLVEVQILQLSFELNIEFGGGGQEFKF